MKKGQQLCVVAVGFLAIAGVTFAVADRGTVLDKSTGKPIAGAHIVTTWTGSIAMPVQSQSRCYHAEATVSDAEGHFSISTFSGNWNPLMFDRNRNLWVLAQGYKYVAREAGLVSLRVLMEPASGSKSEQFKDLPNTYALSCPIDKKLLLPFLKTEHEEMTRLATTLEERNIALSVLFSIESIELGKEEALRRLDVRGGPFRGGRQ